jgi:ribosome maturation factor RimP
LAHDGYDLVLVEYIPQGHILRLYIDHAEGVTLEDCSRVSRLVGDVLDAEAGLEDAEGISGRYTLEVSSPGLDRPLVRPEHYRRFVGEKVRLALVTPVVPEGGRKLSGVLADASDTGIDVDVDGQRHTVTYEQIERARLVPNF